MHVVVQWSYPIERNFIHGSFSTSDMPIGNSMVAVILQVYME